MPVKFMLTGMDGVVIRKGSIDTTPSSTGLIPGDSLFYNGLFYEWDGSKFITYPTYDKVTSDIAAAVSGGLTPDQITAIVNQAVSTAEGELVTVSELASMLSDYAKSSSLSSLISQDQLNNAISDFVTPYDLSIGLDGKIDSDALHAVTDPIEHNVTDLLNSVSKLNSTLNNMGFGVKFGIADTQYQSQVQTPTANNVQLVTSTELAFHQAYDQLYLTDLANQIANAQFTDAQKQQLAADILSQVSTSAVTVDQLNAAIQASENYITLPQTNIQMTSNYNLMFAKYSNGRMEITGTVHGDGTQVIFPDGYSFVNTWAIGVGHCYADLEDQSNSIMHVGKIQVSATDFLWKASSFGVAVLGGAAISDDNMYRITITGHWK